MTYLKTQKLTINQCQNVIYTASKKHHPYIILEPFLYKNNLQNKNKFALECHFVTLLLKVNVVLFTPTRILVYTLKSIITDSKVFALNSYEHQNKQDLFLRQVPKLFCRTRAFMAVTREVRRTFINITRL